MEKQSGFTLTDEQIQLYRSDIKKAKPYTADDPEPDYWDWIADDSRNSATIAMNLLKAAGLWTAEDEAVAFGPHPAPAGSEPTNE